MINLNLKVRRAVMEDQRQISSLIFYEANTHRHLDWRSALEWIGSPNYWVLEDNGRIIAALACPEDPPHSAWIRLFSYHQELSGTEAWSALWGAARDEIMTASPQTHVAAIIVKQWFQNILLASGFELTCNIVLLQLHLDKTYLSSTPPQMQIRPMLESDLPAVTEVDRAAFGNFWHNTFDSLQRAYSQALYATVVEDVSGVAAYQISTGNPFGAHLARLGVRPEAQGRGMGTALVENLIHHLTLHRIGKLSVNTQSDNLASLALYHKLGFARTGEYFPVLAYPTGAL